MEPMNCWDMYESPIGPLTLIADDGVMRQLLFPRKGQRLSEETRRPQALTAGREQLEEYFAGERREFELPLEPLGPASLRRVWEELRTIPYGTTVSYKELAERVGRPGEFREIGAAVGRTPLPILIPCHRVIGSNGDLTGYGGGLHRKQALLDLEGRVAAGLDPEPAWAFRQLALG
jgi:methylated-DNA-[protein]-cysteine S-methyltransferase